MAVWQWTISLVSERLLTEGRSVIPDSISEDRLLEIQGGRFWINIEACKAFFGTLLGNEEMHKSAGQEFWSWGDTKRSDALVVFRNGAVEDIGVRLDANEPDQNLIEPLVEFARSNALLFHVVQTDRLLRPDIEVVRAAFLQSRARLFCSSPEGFFADKDYLDRLNAENQDKLEKM